MAKARRDELSEWLPHSEIVCYTMKNRVCEEIVRLLQEKNLLAEHSGRKFIKVGVIETQLGYRVLAKDKYGPGVHKDYYMRKMALEVQEGYQVLEHLSNDCDIHEKISGEMRSFLTMAFDNPSWERQLAARWLRKKQMNQDNEFDPNSQDIIPIKIADGVEFQAKAESPKAQSPAQIMMASAESGFAIELRAEGAEEDGDVASDLEDPLNILGTTREKKVKLTEVVQAEKA